MSIGRVVCITGIDTDIGKTIVTGMIARYLLDKGHSVITQKICQTGNGDDINIHREIMGVKHYEEDKIGLSCPYVFAEPCSPHLAARLEERTIDLQVIHNATEKLQEKYDYVILEGVGGLMVPLLDDLLLIDYLQKMQYEHVLITTSRLGSINHTISAFELMRERGMYLRGVVYNRFFDANVLISNDSRRIFSLYLKKYGHMDCIVDVPSIDVSHPQSIDFHTIFE